MSGVGARPHAHTQKYEIRIIPERKQEEPHDQLCVILHHFKLF
jgi:hypothetical protein